MTMPKGWKSEQTTTKKEILRDRKNNQAQRMNKLLLKKKILTNRKNNQAQ